ncbi:hypothetical protein GmarT_40820 [Gimesia maris]|uniref:Uncharacterized protein n=2 Tax=Gimesia maris TaxID=122 RepID=A0ABX5YR33_9PLAN|nr:hypothetical protein GmarT_40820 [Gimesia maris]
MFLTPELFATLETAEQARHENNRTLSLVTGVILGGRSLREQLSSMHEDLQVSSPTANQSLRNLIGGEIILEEFDIPLRKRKALRGTFTLTAHGVSGEVVNGSPTQNASEHAKLISIDFIQPDATENQRKIANDMYDNGEPIKNIAEALNVGRSRVILLLHEAFELLGLEKPDGRQRRWQLDTAHQKPLFHQNIADNVMELFHKKKTYGEIARQLGVDRNVITAAVKFWHQQKGLPVPDGRSRRKTL